MLVAASRAAHLWQTLAGQAENVARLGALGQEDLLFPIQRLHVDFAAERGLGERDADLTRHVAPLALEDRMRTDDRDDVQVSRRPARGPGLTFTGEPDPRAGLHARRDLDAQRLRAPL